MKLKAIVVVLSWFAALFLLAVPVLAYTYRAPVAVTNNSSTDYAMLPIRISAPNTYLAANGFMLSSGNDTRIETLGGTKKPHMVTNNLTFTAVPAPVLSQTNLFFTTGNTPQAFSIIPGYNGYVTVNDTAELGGNFSVELSGHINTDSGADKNIFSKNLAWKLYVSPTTAGTVTANITGSAASSNSTTLIPNASGDNTTLDLYGAATNWGSNLTDDGDTSYVANNETGLKQDTYNLSMSGDSYPSLAIIDSVSVYASVRYSTAVRTGDIRTVARLGGIDTTYNTTITGTTYLLKGGAVARPGGGSWLWSDLASLQAGVKMATEDVADEIFCTQVYVVISYHYTDPIINASGIASGNQTITLAEQHGLWYKAASSNFTTISDQDNFSMTNGGGVDTAATWVSWVNIHSLTTDRIIAAKNNGIGLLEWQLVIQSTGKPGIILYDPAGPTTIALETVNPVSVNTQYQIGFTYDGSKTAAGIKIFINGSSVATNDLSGGVYTGMVNTTTPLLIGKRNHATGYPFDGVLSGFKIYKGKALSPTEMLADYNGTNSMTNLVGWWKMDESTGLPQDSSGNAYHATANTASWVIGILKLTIGGNLVGITQGYNVNNNANNTVMMQGNSVAYASWIKYTINGVEKLKYQPASMIQGTQLVDLKGTKNGEFTFGTNPALLTAIMGSIVSSGEVGVGAALTTTPRDILPPVSAPDMFGDGTVSGAILTNPVRPFVTMISDNTTLVEIQVWRWLGFMLWLFVVVAVGKTMRGHQGITAIVAGAILIGLVALDHNIFPWWLLLFSIGLFIAGGIAERTPSY